MKGFESELFGRLEAIQAQGLHRVLRQIDSPQSRFVSRAGREMRNFSSNDYLGLANHPDLKAAAVQAIEQFGAGAGASRLICGSLAPHHGLETSLAEFKGTAAALSFSSGYAAALGAIGALVGRDDVIVLDKLVHASIVDAARLSGAKLRVYPHNDLVALAEILRWAVQRPRPAEGQRGHVMIVTESVFSMDGDIAPLADLVTLKERFGAWLMVDEAHATGMFGVRRRGLAETAGVGDHIEVQMGTLGKALGAAGGYICGSRILIDYLINRARPFIFSTAPVPAAAAAARAAVEIVRTAAGAERCTRLWAHVQRMRSALTERGWRLPDTASAILPLLVGSEAAAVAAAGQLQERGILIPAIRYPTVARGEARLRLTLSAAHTPEDLDHLIAALAELGLAQPTA